MILASDLVSAMDRDHYDNIRSEEMSKSCKIEWFAMTMIRRNATSDAAKTRCLNWGKRWPSSTRIWTRITGA